MIRRIFIVVALAASSVIPSHAKPIEKEHRRLWEALEEVGVEMYVNEPEMCDDMWGGGKYMQIPEKRRSAILICQDKGEGLGLGNSVPYSPNDLDTLRHEAHHAVQDCLAGVRADSELESLFSDDELDEFVRLALSSERIEWIAQRYISLGASVETVLLELEAFAVADDIPPHVIAESVKRFCQIKT